MAEPTKFLFPYPPAASSRAPPNSTASETLLPLQDPSTPVVPEGPAGGRLLRISFAPKLLLRLRRPLASEYLQMVRFRVYHLRMHRDVSWVVMTCAEIFVHLCHEFVIIPSRMLHTRCWVDHDARNACRM